MHKKPVPCQSQGKRQHDASAEAAAAAELGQRLGVLGRREEARTKHALTRLRNYYADVRSATELVRRRLGPARFIGGFLTCYAVFLSVFLYAGSFRVRSATRGWCGAPC